MHVWYTCACVVQCVYVCDVYMCLCGSWTFLGICKVCPKDQFQAIRLLIVLKPDANIMVWIQTVSQSSCAESLVSRHCEVTGSGDPDSISELIHPWTPSPTALWEVAETSGWVLAGGKRPALGPALEGRVSPPAPGLSASLRGLPRHVLPAMVFSLTTAEKHRSQVDPELNSQQL